MISKHDIIKAVRRIKKETKSTRPHRLLYPERDWFIVLTASIIIGMVVVIWSVFSFTTLQNDNYTPRASSDTVPTYDRAKTMQILDFQMAREAQRSTLAPIRPGAELPATEGEEEPAEESAASKPLLSN